MLMRMLGAGGMPLLTDGRRAPDEDNPRGYFEFEPVKRTAVDAGWVAGAVGKAVKVVHLLLPNLPPGYNYRVLFVHRDVREVLASQRRMLDRTGRRGAELPTGRLAEVFEGQVRRVLGWVARQPHFRLLSIQHRQVIEAPPAQAKRINAFLGGILDEFAMAAVVDPSLYRNRHDERQP